LFQPGITTAGLQLARNGGYRNKIILKNFEKILDNKTWQTHNEHAK